MRVAMHGLVTSAAAAAANVGSSQCTLGLIQPFAQSLDI